MWIYTGWVTVTLDFKKFQINCRHGNYMAWMCGQTFIYGCDKYPKAGNDTAVHISSFILKVKLCCQREQFLFVSFRVTSFMPLPLKSYTNTRDTIFFSAEIISRIYFPCFCFQENPITVIGGEVLLYPHGQICDPPDYWELFQNRRSESTSL